MRFYIHTLLILFIGGWSPLVLCELRFPEFPSKNKPVSFNLHTEYFRSHSNYTHFGQYADLPDKNFFQYVAVHPSLSYSPFPYYLNFELFANSFYASSKSMGTSRDVFRPTVAGIGFNIYHKIQTFYAGLELRGGIPLYKNFFEKTNEIILGDGAYFIEPGLWLLFNPSQIFYVYYNTAFRYRMAHLSGLLFNRLGGVLKTQHTDAGLAVHSFISLPSNSQERPVNQVEDRLKTVNGGSYTFYSIKPSVLAWTAWLELKFQPIFTKIYFNLNTLGNNYARGFSFGLVTKFKWSTKPSITERKRVMRFRFDEDEEETAPSSERNSYFEEEDDLYNKKNINQELKQELNFLKH